MTKGVLGSLLCRPKTIGRRDYEFKILSLLVTISLFADVEESWKNYKSIVKRINSDDFTEVDHIFILMI